MTTLEVAAVAAFPKLAFWGLRTALGHRARGLLAYFAAHTAFHFALRAFFLPYARRAHAKLQRLEQQLGHEPTPEELEEHFKRTR